MCTIQEYVNEIQAAETKRWNAEGYKLPAPVIAYTEGKVYYKVTHTNCGQTSVHCFVDKAGNIYKASGWNAPAKGIRGSIHAEKKPLLGYQFYR